LSESQLQLSHDPAQLSQGPFSFCPKFTFVHYPVTMANTDPERFRSEAEKCRQQAESATNPLDKEAWLKLAADWIKLAEGAEQRGRTRL
jgi:hypothetical protein